MDSPPLLTPIQILYIFLAIPLVFSGWSFMSKNIIYIPPLWSHILDLILHPIELLAVIRYLLFKRKKWSTIFGPHDNRKEEAICIQALTKVSPGVYAESMRELPEKIRAPMTLAYLIGRTLDSIEDDVSLPTKIKIDQLTAFPSLLIDKEAAVVAWKRYLDLQRRHSNEYEKGPNFWRKINKKGGCDNGLSPAELFLLQNFESVLIVYGRLEEEYRSIAFETIKFMCGGMAKFVAKGTIETIEEFEEYSYYVTGCTFPATISIIHASGVVAGEGQKKLECFLKRDEKVPAYATALGSLVMVVDGIMDLVEDLSQPIPRTYLPRQIWGKYVTRVDQLIQPEFKREALLCVNEIAIYGVKRIPEILKFLVKSSKDQCLPKWWMESIVLGPCFLVSSLTRCYNNEKILKTAVFVRSGEMAQICLRASSLYNVFCILEKYLKEMVQKTPRNDSNFEQAMETLKEALDVIAEYKMRKNEFSRGWK